MRGAGSKDIVNNGLERYVLENDICTSSIEFGCTTWAYKPVELPLACLPKEGTPPLEPFSPRGSTICDAVTLPSSTQDKSTRSPCKLQTFAGDQPCDATCTISHAPGSPATNDPPPPQPMAPSAPPLPPHPPSWTEPQSIGNTQHAAETCVSAGALATPVQGPVQEAVVAQPPNTPLQQTLLPRLAAASKASKSLRGFTQRNRAKVAENGANYSGLLAQKAALECELVTLLNRHERLSRGLPWHLQHEEVSFMASIARCMAAGRPGALQESAETDLEPSGNLFQKLMLDPCATMNDVYKAAGIGAAFPAGCEQPSAPDLLEAVPEKIGSKRPVWSSIVTFLKLSKPQKDKLAAAYDAHVQRAAAVRRECLAIGTKLQAEGVLRPNLATHLACGHLTGIAKEDKDLVLILNKECYEVLNQVQLNNLLALAPPGSAAALGLCREIAGPCAAAATAEVGTPLTKRRQDAPRPLPAVTNNAAGDMHECPAVITDAATLATTSGGAANAPRNASAQAARTKQVTGAGTQMGTSAQLMGAAAPPSRRRKRQAAGTLSDSEGRPASK